MSYADAAAKGPKQSPEEARAPAPPQILEQELSPKPLVDVDGPHVDTVPSNFSGRTETQQQRLEAETEQAKARFQQAEKEAKEQYGKGKSVAAKKAKEAKDSLSHAGHELNENKENPVVVGNVIVWAAVAGALGFGAYKQHQAGTLNWKVAGTWAGVVGLFAAGDYYLSQYLFKNKYPRK